MKITINPAHRETVEIDGATFVIRPLTGGDMLECYSIGEPAKVAIEMVERGVVEWSNVIGHDDKPIERTRGVRLLPKSAIESLLSKIHQLSTVDAETAKN